jgi:hypothetical protein
LSCALRRLTYRPEKGQPFEPDQSTPLRQHHSRSGLRHRVTRPPNTDHVPRQILIADEPRSGGTSSLLPHGGRSRVALKSLSAVAILFGPLVDERATDARMESTNWAHRPASLIGDDGSGGF